MTRPLSLLLGATVLVAAACSGGGSATAPTATSIPRSPEATAERAASPTPDILGSAEPDGNRVLEHIRKLSVEIGPRVSGTQSEILARDYIEATLESYGYEVSIQEFAFDSSAFRPLRVEIAGEPVLGIGFDGTGVGDVTGPVVAAGIGRPEDFPAGGLNGAIALIERGELTFTEKVDNAIDAGASGVLIYNNESEGNVLGKLDEEVAIPVAGIRRDTGLALIARLEAGPVDVRIFVEELGVSFNVIAHGPGVTTCDTVTGGHYDTVPVTGGASDNASGTSAVLETARVMAARNARGAHCFVLFGAEEFGLFGSRYFVAELPDADLNALRGMINLDVVGLPQELELIGSEDLVREASLIADGMGLPSRPSFVPDGLGSDHASFQQAGVPVVFLYRNDPLIHTIEDEISRMSTDSLRETVAIAVAMLDKLAQ